MTELKLYTMTATTPYEQLPANMKTGWSMTPSDILRDHGVQNPDITTYISLNGRLCQKCVFISNQALAEQFAKWLQAKIDRTNRPIVLNTRRAGDCDLMYRRKKAMGEAQTNDAKILKLMESEA